MNEIFVFAPMAGWKTFCVLRHDALGVFVGEHVGENGADFRDNGEAKSRQAATMKLQEAQ